MLKNYIENTLKEKNILLMTHIVIGYPTFEKSFKIVESMVEAGVDLMELQIPFSEPIADGPVILHANQQSLDNGATVSKCFDFTKQLNDRFDIPFLFMTYHNILFKYGIRDFIKRSSQYGIKGFIIPDLPPEEGEEYLASTKEFNLSPIFLFSPTTSDERMKYLSSHCNGFIYCLARKGVTGTDTDFSNELNNYLSRCRSATDMPLALGFGVKQKSDIDFLKGKIDIAILGSAIIRLVDKEGINAVGKFIKGLR